MSFTEVNSLDRGIDKADVLLADVAEVSALATVGRLTAWRGRGRTASRGKTPRETRCGR